MSNNPRTQTIYFNLIQIGQTPKKEEEKETVRIVCGGVAMMKLNWNQRWFEKVGMHKSLLIAIPIDSSHITLSFLPFSKLRNHFVSRSDSLL